MYFIFNTVLTFFTLFAQANTTNPIREAAAEFRNNLFEQMEHLAHQSSKQCPNDYKNFSVDNNLKIALFYGYDGQEGRTYDRALAQSMAYALTRKCFGTLQACSFKTIKRSQQNILLNKNIAGQNVTIDIYWTTVTDDESINLDPEKGYWAQEKASERIKKIFAGALKSNDIVLFSGHSRGGGGLGFEYLTLEKAAWDLVFRSPAKMITASLSAAKNGRLKLFGSLSCQSHTYYGAEFFHANNTIDYILTTGDILTTSGEQISLGLLNSILSKKCSKEFRESLISPIEPNPEMIKYIRHKQKH